MCLGPMTRTLTVAAIIVSTMGALTVCGQGHRADRFDSTDRCNGKVTDLTTDSNNCGACANRCARGGVCKDGLCRCGQLEEERNGFCIAKLVDLGSFAIDATEVTVGQYASWLETNPKPKDTMPGVCSLNVSHVPKHDWPLSNGNRPVTDVNWCDAFAYCKAVGKRLCGKIGGGSNEFYDFADAAKSQWAHACSGGGKYWYPYGDKFDSARCNGVETSGSPLSVTTMPECECLEFAYSGIYDLSGNVQEWEDSCTVIANTFMCRLRGGSFYAPDEYLPCAGAVGYVAHYNAMRDIGFRCCAP